MTLTPDEIEAIGFALDLAYQDQENYFQTGDPKEDYGPSWNDERKMKADYFRTIGKVAQRLGMSGERERWNDLEASMPQ